MMSVQYYRFIFTIILFINQIFAFTIKYSSAEFNHLTNLTSEMAKRCFPDNKAVYLIPDSSLSLYTDFYESISYTVTIFNNSTQRIDDKVPISCVIMILSSPKKISEVFVDEKWRSFNQYYMILDGDSDNGCINAQVFLMEAWKNDVLNVIFVCRDNQEKILKFFTFNPFTDFAPMPWQKLQVVRAINDHPLTFFYQDYNPDVPCNVIFFEKTHNFGKYIAKTVIFYSHPFVTWEKPDGKLKLKGYDVDLISLLMDNLNLTLSVDKIATIVDQFDNLNDSRGILWGIVNKTVDFTMNSLVSRNTLQKAESTYPFDDAKINVITLRREFKEFGGQLFTFLPLLVAVHLFVANFLVYLLLRYVFQDPYSRHLIDVFRVYLNLPLPTIPLTSKGRIIFGATLVSFTIANIIVQANMNTVMTSKNTARNVEVFEDLEALNLKIFCFRFIYGTLKNNGIEAKIDQTLTCSQLKDNEAYIGKELILRTRLSKTCHMAKKPIISGMFNSYYTRRNWPIFPKLHKKLLVLFESGLNHYLSERILRSYPYLQLQKPEQYQIISMDHMLYVFYAFIFGIFVSTIAFLIELYLTRLSYVMNSILHF